jgi:hypothetical protein
MREYASQIIIREIGKDLPSFEAHLTSIFVIQSWYFFKYCCESYYGFGIIKPQDSKFYSRFKMYDRNQYLVRGKQRLSNNGIHYTNLLAYLFVSFNWYFVDQASFGRVFFSHEHLFFSGDAINDLFGKQPSFQNCLHVFWNSLSKGKLFWF